MEIKNRGRLAIITMLHLISFVAIIVGGLMMLGSQFFYYVGEGFNYVYQFAFVRPIDTKTYIAYAVLALALILFVFWIVHDVKRKSLRLFEIIAPITSFTCPFIILALIRGNGLGVIDTANPLVIVELVFVAIYVLTSIAFILCGFSNVAKERKEEKRLAAAPVPAPAPVEEKVVEKVVEVVKVVEPAKEPEPVVDESVAVSTKKIVRKPFTEKMSKASSEIKDTYNILKNELLSYGVKSRVSHSGDTFRLRKREYARITLVGKNLKLYLATNPAKYDNTTIPVRDESGKKCFAETPTMIKVKSNLSIKRAKMMIADLMEERQLPQGNVENVDYAKQLKGKNARKAKK